MFSPHHVDTYGRLDVAVNNAARTPDQGTLWLASDASSYVHGTTLQIDGGYINR